MTFRRTFLIALGFILFVAMPPLSAICFARSAGATLKLPTLQRPGRYRDGFTDLICPSSSFGCSCISGTGTVSWSIAGKGAATLIISFDPSGEDYAGGLGCYPALGL